MRIKPFKTNKTKTSIMSTLAIVNSDPYLVPFKDAITGRYEYYKFIEKKLTGENQSLSARAKAKISRRVVLESASST